LANVAGHVVFRIGTAATIFAAVMARNAVTAAVRAVFEHDATATSSALIFEMTHSFLSCAEAPVLLKHSRRCLRNTIDDSHIALKSLTTLRAWITFHRYGVGLFHAPGMSEFFNLISVCVFFHESRLQNAVFTISLQNSHIVPFPWHRSASGDDALKHRVKDVSQICVRGAKLIFVPRLFETGLHMNEHVLIGVLIHPIEYLCHKLIHLFAPLTKSAAQVHHLLRSGLPGFLLRFPPQCGQISGVAFIWRLFQSNARCLSLQNRF
jgi:hypothetical protein